MSPPQSTKLNHPKPETYVQRKQKRRSEMSQLLSISLFFFLSADIEAADWHSSWRAKNGGVTNKTLQIQQADLIAKEEAGYYERVGENRNTYYVTNNSTDNSTTNTSDNRTGSFQETYSVGSLNASTSVVTIDGNANAVNADNTASNDGAVNGSISATPTAWTDLFQEVSLDANDETLENPPASSALAPYIGQPAQ